MVQRYVVHNTEMNRINDGDLHDNKEWSVVVKYEDYLALHALMCRLTDQFNLCEIPDDLYEALEAAGIL